ncbi:MAG: MFS transporter [Alphaproteobacteria bacterium HGW-Alphaproteobacteria-16]|nr:MAG: MFS transporter [Alphaproteobacteria bacterium HGW-Alphaproteobacteria-16]
MDIAPPGGRKPGIPQGITVIIAGFLPILAIVAMFPAVPALMDHFAANPDARWKVPAMVSAPGMTIAIVALFAGVLVDKFGRRKLLLASAFFYGVFGTAPYFLDTLDGIYVSRLALGLSEAALLTTLNTLIADYWDERGRRNWLTLQGLAGPFLASFVIFGSGYLASTHWNAVFLIYLIGFPITLAIWAFLYEPPSDDAARKVLGIDAPGTDAPPFPWRQMLTIGGVTLISSALYYVFIINGGMVWREVGVQSSAEIGRLTSLPSLFVMAGAAIFWLLDRKGLSSRAQIAAFLTILGGGLVILGLAPDWRWVIVGLIVQQTGAGMAVPTLIAWAQRGLPYQHRGRGMGLWTACFFFGQFSSPLLVNAIRGVDGSMQAAFATAGIVGLIGAALAFFVVARDGGSAPIVTAKA